MRALILEKAYFGIESTWLEVKGPDQVLLRGNHPCQYIIVLIIDNPVNLWSLAIHRIVRFFCSKTIQVGWSFNDKQFSQLQVTPNDKWFVISWVLCNGWPGKLRCV